MNATAYDHREGMTMQPRACIVWSKRELDLADPWQRKCYLKQVLLRGRSEDVVALDWDEIQRVLPELDLPTEVRALWEKHFADETTCQ